MMASPHENICCVAHKAPLYCALLIGVLVSLLSLGCASSNSDDNDQQGQDEARFNGNVLDVVILARDQVELQEGAAVRGSGPRQVGDIVVTTTIARNQDALTLSGVSTRGSIAVGDGGEADFIMREGSAIIGAADSANHVVAEAIRIESAATVDADVWFDKLDNDGAILGMLQSPLGPVAIAGLPPFPSGAPGDTDITVAPGDRLTITSSSDYGDIVVKDGASLTIEFTDGRVDARSLWLGNSATLLIDATSNVAIWLQDKWITGDQAQVGPAPSAMGIDASNIVIYVADRVNPGLPPAVGIGGGNRVQATIYVDLDNRGGMLRTGALTQVTGALFAPQIVVGDGAVVQFASFFGGASPDMIISPQVFNIDENSANGATVGTVVATASDGGALTYGIVGGSSNTAFAIDSATGEVTVADSGQLNFEATPSLTLDVQVDGGAGGVGQATMTIDLNDVNEAPAIDNQVFNVDENVADGTSLGVVAASDPDAGDALAFSILDGDVGNAFAINASSGEITVNNPPGLDFELIQVFSLTVQVEDSGQLLNMATLTINVNNLDEVISGNAPPVLGAIGNRSVDELTTLSFTASASDADVPAQVLSFSLDAAALANGMSIDAASGVFSWTPTETQSGSVFNATITVTDNGVNPPTLSDAETISITVNETNTAPALDPIGNQSVDELTTLNFTATASDADAPANALTFSLAGAAPAGASITPGGAFSWTPTEAQGPGIFTFDVVVTDNGNPSLANRETITVTVNEVNAAPALNAIGNQSAGELSPLTFTARASDADNPANSLSFSLDAAALANGMSINANSGVFSWTPTETQGGSAFNATITVTDNGMNPSMLSDAETISITVNETNTAPALDPIGNQSVDELTTLNFTATASDADDPANALTFSLSGTAPAGASITPGGVFSWTPTEAQGPGMFTFDVVVTDNGSPNLADSETITVTVNEVNTAPTLNAIGNQSVDELSPLNFTATASDADAPANTLSFSLDAAALANGMSIDAASGVFSWTPTEAQGGSAFNATITVTDNGVNPPALSDAETISIMVNETNTAPALDPIGNQSVDELTALNFTATASDADDPANALTFSLAGAAPAGASITPGGVFSWTPTEGQGPGMFTFDVVVMDDGSPNLADSETITVTVNEVNVAPQIVSAAITTGMADQLYSYDVDATDADQPANTLTFSLDTAPTGMSIDPNSGLIQWTPSNAQVGDHNVTARVTDAGSLFDTQSFSIQVDPANTPPSAVDDSGLNVLGNVGIDAPAGSGVFGNDDLGVPTATITAFDAVSVNGGAVTMNLTSGAFTYEPPAGFTGSDSFTYTLGNAGGTSVATVTLNVAGMIWFIDSSATGSDAGTLANPFNALADHNGNTLDANGDCIFLAAGAYSGGINLQNAQVLVGQGSSQSIDAVCGVTLPPFSVSLPAVSGARPSITNAGGNGVTLGSDNTIRGLDIGATAAASDGIAGASVGTLTIDEVAISGAGGGVNLANGVLAVTLDAVSSSGSDNGINIANTTGSFTVTGDGDTGTQGGNDTGGVILNTSGDGVALSNATNITLQNMTIGDVTAAPADSPDGVNSIGDDGVNAANVINLDLLNVTLARVATHGVRGVSVTNFTLDNSLVLNAGDAQEENGLDFTELRGDNFISRSLFDAFNESGIKVMNSSGTVDLTIDDTTFQDNKSTVGNAGEEAILLVASVTAEIVALITGDPNTGLTTSIFDDIKTQGVQAISEGTASNIELTVENSRFVEHDAGDAIIIMNPDSAGNGKVTVRNNVFTDDTNGAFALLAKNDSSGTLDVTMQGNTATDVQLLSINHDSLGSGGAANGTTRALIGGGGAGEGNVSTLSTNNFSVDIIATETPSTGSAPDVSLTIQNNTASQPQNFFFIASDLRIDIQNATRANLNISGNTFLSDGGMSGIEVRESNTAVVGLEGFAGGNAAAAQAFIDSQNPLTPVGSFVSSHDSNISAGAAALPTATTRPNP